MKREKDTCGLAMPLTQGKRPITLDDELQLRDDNAIYALHRYFITANLMRHHYDKLREAAASVPGELGARAIEMNIYMSYWFAGVYVVIEGWQGSGLTYEEIDLQLQDAEKVKILKRFRNYVYHYRKRYLDPRYTDLIDKGGEIVPWIRALWESFGRYFLRELPRIPRNALIDTNNTPLYGE